MAVVWSSYNSGRLKSSASHACSEITLLKMKQEAQLILTNPRDAFTGQSRSPNMHHSIC